jgi:predicted RND superfamily exporter protein
MAISWVWILGIMQLIGLQFNIVNIILATFIFGQGDDYTIFVIEGLIYEHKTGKRMLPQYRRSIILSAIIMLLGIGVLIIARHPAMHSLGAVTLIGMIVVVILANIVPV